jgi:quercetin dioxygenase-like cupin family protein
MGRGEWPVDGRRDEPEVAPLNGPSGPDSRRGLHVPAGTGRALGGPGDRYDILTTGAQTEGSLFLIECHVAQGGGPPPHVHTRETESFYVLSGAFRVTIGDDVFDAGRGDFVVVPRGQTHSFANLADGVSTMLALFSPAGMEGWFTDALDDLADRDAVPPPPTPEMIERMLSVGPRYGVEWKLPDGP